jgi:hypothetical protein
MELVASRTLGGGRGKTNISRANGQQQKIKKKHMVLDWTTRVTVAIHRVLIALMDSIANMSSLAQNVTLPRKQCPTPNPGTTMIPP